MNEQSKQTISRDLNIEILVSKDKLEDLHSLTYWRLMQEVKLNQELIKSLFDTDEEKKITIPDKNELEKATDEFMGKSKLEIIIQIAAELSVMNTVLYSLLKDRKETLGFDVSDLSKQLEVSVNNNIYDLATKLILLFDETK